MKHPMETPQLTSGEIILQPYGQEHDRQTVTWLTDREIMQTFGITTALDIHSHRQWIEAQENLFIWAIIIPANKHIGNATLRINRKHRSGYFEMYLGNSACRGKGYGWKTLSAILDYAFTVLSLHRTALVTLPGNIPAERLYKKAGFVREGIQRQAIYRAGKFEDQYCWGLLASEWRPEQASP